MKKMNNVMGRMDYFSSIDKLANDFMPTQKTPLSVGNYDYIGAFEAPMKKKYSASKQQMSFSPPKKRFDPYENTWGRQVQKTMHYGPAQSSELNRKQMGELIHELKERKHKKTVEDAKEIRTLSRKYMNSPWAAVPERYRMKYGKMDFDRDGVPNDKDCYPFDYDRQANIFSGISSAIASFFSPPKPAPAPAPKPAPAPAPKPAPAPAPAKTTTTSYFSTTPTSSYFNIPTSAPKTSTPAPKTSTPAVSTPTKSSSSGSSSSGTMYYMNSDGSRGAAVPAPAPGTMVTSQSTIGGQTTVSQVQPDGSLKVISTTPGVVTPEIAAFGAGIGRIAGGGGGGGGGSSGGSGATETITPPMSALTIVYDPTVDFYITKNYPIYGDVIDDLKRQQIYNDILNGKLNDPTLKAMLENQMGPVMTEFLRNKSSADNALLFQNRIISAATARKTGDIARLGGSNLANVYGVSRAQDILQQRAQAASAARDVRVKAEAEKLSEAQTKIQGILTDKASTEALSETMKRASDFTKTGVQVGTQQGQEHVTGRLSTLTPEQQLKYNALHP